MIRRLWRIKCDLCGRVEENDGFNAWRATVPVLVTNEWGGRKVESREYDLCPDCIDVVTTLSLSDEELRLRDDGSR